MATAKKSVVFPATATKTYVFDDDNDWLIDLDGRTLLEMVEESDFNPGDEVLVITGNPVRYLVGQVKTVQEVE
jgi:hypothetical protein